VKAEPEVQHQLLDLAQHDLHISQILHRRAHLPEAKQAAELQDRLDRISAELIAAETIVSDLIREQNRADADVDQVRERARKDQELLDSGTINDPKQLQNLQHELQSLARRQRELEDVELEVMERAEGAASAVRVLAEQKDGLTTEVNELSVVVAGLLADIEEEFTREQAERVALAEGLPPDLLALYEKIRTDQGGVGAARFHRGRCEGCQMELPPTEREALQQAAADAIIRCEECRRILIRTDESGL
jgi:uncharacterized protein